MGLPISVQYTEAERNRTHAGDGFVTTAVYPADPRFHSSLNDSNLNLPPGVSHRGGMQ